MSKTTVDLGGFEAYINTNRFEQLSRDNQDIVQARVMALPFVIESSTLGGWVKVEFKSFDELPSIVDAVREMLEKRISKGEGVAYGEYYQSLADGQSARTVRYVEATTA